MNTLLQPGQHPDADTLSAFAEHALPTHEQQQTLAHLVTCPDCRALVSLAQQAAPIDLPQPEPARRPWFTNWRLGFTAAAALACLILLTIHLRPTAAPPTPTTTASVEPAQPTLPPPPLIAVAPIATPVSPQPTAPALKSAPRASTLAQADADSFAAAPSQSLLETRQQSPLPSPLNSSNVTVTVEAQAAAPAMPIPPAPAPQIASGIASGTSINESQVQALSESAATASVIGAAAPITASRATAAFSAARLAKREPDLPSHLPAVSTIANARETLALDTAGALFRSEDAGVTWRPIASQWQGRATHLTLAPQQVIADKLATTAAEAKSAATPPALFELTTDTNHAYTSPDGQTWRRK